MDETPEQEIDLLRRARTFDEAALGTIFDTYYESLYRYAYHRVQHVETAEDIAAQVFTRLLDALQGGVLVSVEAGRFMIQPDQLLDFAASFE